MVGKLMFVRKLAITRLMCNVCQIRTGYLNSSYKTTAKGHDDTVTADELVKLVQPSDLLQLTQTHNRSGCIVLWIEYDSCFLVLQRILCHN